MKLSKEAKALIDKWFDNKTPEEVDYIISKYKPNKQLNIHSVAVPKGTLPNNCKVCGRTIAEMGKMTSMCGVSACPNY